MLWSGIKYTLFVHVYNQLTVTFTSFYHCHHSYFNIKATPSSLARLMVLTCICFQVRPINLSELTVQWFHTCYSIQTCIHIKLITHNSKTGLQTYRKVGFWKTYSVSDHFKAAMIMKFIDKIRKPVIFSIYRNTNHSLSSHLLLPILQLSSETRREVCLKSAMLLFEFEWYK